MKQLFLILVFSSVYQLALAQSNGPGGCGITYEYNALGQRVKRSKECVGGGGGGNSSRPAHTEASNTLPQELLSIKAYPSPAREHVTVSFSKAISGGVLELLDSKGALIMKQTLGAETQRHTLSLASLAQGLYLIRFTQQNKVYQTKIIKE